MRWLVLAFALVIASTSRASADSAPKPSGPLKAYQGPEGEIVVMIEVNDGTGMLVHVKKLGGELEGKTKLYLFEDQGQGNKVVYTNQKRGSKTYRSIILSARDNDWTLYIPGKNEELKLHYSEELSQKITVDDVLAAYRP